MNDHNQNQHSILMGRQFDKWKDFQEIRRSRNR